MLLNPVVVVVSDNSRGWEWINNVVCEHFGVMGNTDVIGFSADRGLFFLSDDQARAKVTDRAQ